VRARTRRQSPALSRCECQARQYSHKVFNAHLARKTYRFAPVNQPCCICHQGHQ
jgi:hypothetical protein